MKETKNIKKKSYSFKHNNHFPGLSPSHQTNQPTKHYEVTEGERAAIVNVYSHF